VVKALFYTQFNIVGIFEMGLDHMEDNAIVAHHTGHLLAMEAAARATHIKDQICSDLSLN
jgi:hypothetical protein